MNPYRVTVYRTVVDEPLSALASIAADMEDHVSAFVEAAKKPRPKPRLTKREQRRQWRDEAFRRARCR